MHKAARSLHPPIESTPHADPVNLAEGPSFDCPHRPACPGCPLADLPYAEQLAHKQDAVAQAMRLYPYLDKARIDTIEPSATTVSYRMRAKLVASAKGLGLFAGPSHEVIDTPSCKVLRPLVSATLQALRGMRLPSYGVTSVDVREVDDGVLVTLATDAVENASLTAMLRAWSKGVSNVVSIAISQREEDAPRVLGRLPKVVVGPSAARHTLDPDAPYCYASPGAFTQVHHGQSARIHRHVESVLTERLDGLDERCILELFAGEGALALRLARAGARVTLVESLADPVALASRAASEQGLRIKACVGDAADEVRRLVALGTGVDAMVVNPPRRGLTPDVRLAMARWVPEVVVYVSCCPTTLARDASDLARLGLRLVSVRPYDMIPLSDSVETLAVFVPSRPVAPRVVYQDESLLVVDKPGHEPLLSRGEEGESLLDRVRQHCDAPDAVALHDMDAGASGLCLLARTPRARQELSKSVAHRSSTWVVLAKGIMHPKGHLRIRRTGHGQGRSMQYARTCVVGGHSLCEVRVDGNDGLKLPAAVARVGHPVVGDPRSCDAGTNAYFLHRHGLDRVFAHVARVQMTRHGRTLNVASDDAAEGATDVALAMTTDVKTDLAPDLVAVRDSLGR